MKLNTPIRRGTPDWQREMIEMETETEHDAEILDATFPLQTVQSWPATPASPPTTLDALLAPEEIGIHWGVPFLHRPERADEQAAVSYLTVRQAGA